MNNIDVEQLVSLTDILEYVKQYVELSEKGNEYWGLSPFNNEKTPSFSVNQEKQVYYDFSSKSNGNVLSFIMEYHKVTFVKAIEILCNYLNLNETDIKTQASIIKILKKYNKTDNDIITSRIYLKDDIMNNYSSEPIKEWISEGISQEVMNKYQVKYDYENNRIVFPIYDNDGKIISISGRTLDEMYKEKKIRKYTYYHKINNLDFFYGYYQNKEKILEKNEIIIFEGLKSILKAEDYGYMNCVASLTDALSKHQVKKLLEINCKNIIICWDNGVSYENIIKQTKMLKHFKNIYIMKYFTEPTDLLDDKDSPVDKGKLIFEHFYNTKIKLK